MVKYFETNLIAVKLTKIQKEHFDKRKNRYDAKKINNPPVHTVLEVERLMKHIPDGINWVVDFGAGNGRLTVPLLENGYSVVAIDISHKSLRELRKIAGNNKTRLVTKESLSEIGKADVVMGCDVLHHVELESELDSIYSKLSVGGTAAFSEPNFLNISWVIYFFLKGIWKYEKGIVNFSYFNLRRILIKSGFTKIRIIGLGILPRVLFQNRLFCKINDFLGDLPILKLFAYRYIILVQKKLFF